MNIKIAIAALVAAVAADKADFPEDNFMHAHCLAMSAIQMPCVDVFSTFTDSIKSRAEPAKGTYALKEESDYGFGYIWATRLGSGGKYTDDVMWEFGDIVEGNCLIHAKSRSQSISVLDYNTNYCNIFNVFRMSGLDYSPLTTDSCTYNDESACDEY